MADGLYMANRNVRVSTTKGHVYIFKQGAPLYVAPEVRAEMLQYGILPVNDELPVSEAAARSADPVGEDRKLQLLEAIAKVVSENSSDHFTAGGVPKTTVLGELTGFEVGTAERNEAWKEYQQADY
jgi:hypothetical protein